MSACMRVWGECEVVKSSMCIRVVLVHLQRVRACACTAREGGRSGGVGGCTVACTVGGRGGKEFSILTAWGTKLAFSLLVLARRLLHLLPDGRMLKKPCVGWVVSPMICSALRVTRVL